jgi:hypothetical protein
MDPENRNYANLTTGEWTMNMPDGGTMIPDLEWFDRQFSPDISEEDRDHMDTLRSVYGNGAFLSEKQIADEKLKTDTARRRKHAKIVRPLRRLQIERTRVYSGSDYGSF